MTAASLLLFFPLIAAALYIALLLRYRTLLKIRGIHLDAIPPAELNEGVVISVVVAARNEEKVISGLLHSLRSQTLSSKNFEVIIVDDFSDDGTTDVVAKEKASNVKLLMLKDISRDDTKAQKKRAIDYGVREARGKLIVCTDADCIPGKEWLSTILAAYRSGRPAFIVMPVQIDIAPHPPGFIRFFQALDFLSLQGITAAAVKGQKLHMCNGANLAYEKAAFEKVNGFASVDTIASGDDMLLMHKICTEFPQRLTCLWDKRVIMRTAPVHTVRDFFQQRIRWASKSGRYNDKRILPVLLIVYICNLSLLLLPLICIFYNPAVISSAPSFRLSHVWCALILMKTIAEIYFLLPVAGFFGMRKWLWFFPLLQPAHILYTVIAGFLGKFSAYEWKGRKVQNA